MASDQPYSQPNGLLYNKLYLSDPQELAKAEADFTRIRMVQLEKQPIEGRFDLAHLQAIHRHIFQDVYSWAGELRTVNITKGDSVFAFAQYLESSANKLLNQLSRENHLKDLTRQQFVERAAHYMTELNAIHPFREGNGRSSRAFFEQLGKEAGHSLDLSAVPRQMINLSAEKAHLTGDSKHMQPVIQAALRAELNRGIER